MITIARRFLGRPAADRRLLMEALALHVCVAVLLRTVRFGTLTKWLGAGVHRPELERPSADAAIGRIVWAVRQATAAFPLGRTCLTEALTAEVLLRRAGCAATLRYGVATDGAGRDRVAAHAWLERHGDVLIGGSPRGPVSQGNYVPLERGANVAEMETA